MSIIEQSKQRAMDRGKAAAFDRLAKDKEMSDTRMAGYQEGGLAAAREINDLMSSYRQDPRYVYEPREYGVGQMIPETPMDAAVYGSNPVLPSPNTGDVGLAGTF